MATGNFTENFVKFEHVIFEMCKQADRHTDMKIAILHDPARGEVTVLLLSCGFTSHVSSAIAQLATLSAK